MKIAEIETDSCSLDRSPNPLSRSSKKDRWVWQDSLVAAFLFLASAAVIIWQNSRLGVIWDLGYILENGFRISLGDIPYKDFPFPYPPLTFLIQAAIIRITGRVFWHHIVYCALAGGLGAVLTWRILVHILRMEVARYRLIAFTLSLPLIVLGIYAIFPHPFYDPDCCFAILLAVFLLQRVERKKTSTTVCLLAGAALVMPLLVKQNAGIPFVGSTLIAVLILAIIEIWRRRSVKKYALVIAGALVSIAIALLLIHFISGLKNYWYWTITFAGMRRTPATREMIEIYADKNVIIWMSFILAGLIIFRLSRWGNSRLAILSAMLFTVPFLWPAIYLWRDSDSSERAERLLGLWPLVLILALIVAVLTIRRRHGFSLMLPFILIATINGVFMSQQLWGSTYAIWPLFMILLADVLTGLTCLARTNNQETAGRLWRGLLVPLTSLIALSSLIAGGFYVWSHERLDYANLDDGELKRSSLPALKGLSVRGDWLPNFDELVQYGNQEIPREDGILLLPGEDVFFYATGRRPQFPVVMFDRTVNPYGPEEILRICRERNIRWLISKQDLQDEDEEPEKQRDAITEALSVDFKQVKSLTGYDIYRRRGPNEPKDEDQDDSDDDDDNAP